ncbi:DUF881 domain-containing protein [Desulfotomaculum copahuensis]|uniref:Division initiation protein n=1 Tax=Desulfotomaculum copahuensis TaxID=1838280 RepID=A0A1B7LEU8_9FIRM|nr:DUF881 domain-containing protein [Desulfotomaculum copahuensis]OAT81801.1 hypothetical protein A6M21_10415 [Desulfotomaculum copahuensis]
MKIRGFHWGLALVGLVMGIMLAVQFRLTRDIEQTPPVQQTQSLAAQVNQARRERDQLQQQADQLRARLNRVASGPQVDTLKTEINKARLLAGTVAATGPGVEVSLNDSNLTVQPGENPNLYVLHDEDVLKVINELKAAGAEAVSINGQRLLATSEVRCIGPTILTNQSHRLTPPFVIAAIGNPDTMINALQMRGGVVEQLRFWGIQVSIKKLAQLNIPAYNGSISFDYARPAAVREGGGA